MLISIKFVPRDLWVGLYIEKPVRSSAYPTEVTRKLYVCLIPMFPICLEWEGK